MNTNTKKRKQKQYTKQFELDIAIIRLRRLAERKEVKAKEFDREFHTYDTMSTDPDAPAHLCKFNGERAYGFKKKATTLRQQINGIYERRIPRLIQAKAELATTPMAFMESNGVSV